MAYSQKGGHKAEPVAAVTVADGRVSSHTARGLDVDGIITPLEGEPPIAVSKSWGNLAFLYRPATGGN